MSDESAVCSWCGRGWPATTFRGMARSIMAGESPEPPERQIICDKCIEITSTRESQVAAKLDEAQAGVAAAIVRQVVVTGIKSGTQVISFRYPTHVNRDALAITDLVVTFENGSEYLYENVPVIVCEAWMEASSFGTYFVQQIKTSYGYKKVK